MVDEKLPDWVKPGVDVIYDGPTARDPAYGPPARMLLPTYDNQTFWGDPKIVNAVATSWRPVVAAQSVDEHPLPWRWGVGPGEDPRERPNLLDANGAPLISRASGCTVASSYVRAVTERAKALEQVVRYALPILARAHDLPADLVPGPVYGAGRALIAQIDAAKEEERDG